MDRDEAGAPAALRAVKKEKISDNHFRLEIKDLPAGYYLLSLKEPSAGLNHTYKFLKR